MKYLYIYIFFFNILQSYSDEGDMNLHNNMKGRIDARFSKDREPLFYITQRLKMDTIEVNNLILYSNDKYILYGFDDVIKLNKKKKIKSN